MSDTDLFQRVFSLEGNLSNSQHLRLREQTIEQGGGFEMYCQLMQSELNDSGTSTVSVEITQNPNTAQLYLQASDGQHLRIPTQYTPEFCAVANVTDTGTYRGDRAQEIWAVAEQYAG